MITCDRCGEMSDTGTEYCSECLSVMTVLDVPDLVDSTPFGNHLYGRRV